MCGPKQTEENDRVQDLNSGAVGRIKIHKDQEYSGLKGKALHAAKLDTPSRAEIMSVIPAHCFKKSTATSMLYCLTSCTITGSCAVAAHSFLPLQASWILAWMAYAVVTGTAVTGCWVVAHECGHGAFSDNVLIRDAVGYVLHTMLLVPYFSWQRSHAVHHSRTNHATEGETHVPSSAMIPENQIMYKLRSWMGERLYTFITLPLKLIFGWPLYLLLGASGGPVRGQTNHFLPNAGSKGQYELFPGKWKDKVWMSDAGIAAFLLVLVHWAVRARSIAPVLALYGGPLLVCNAWLVLYTWLQHTDVDVPHLDHDTWTWQKGAFLTIDRPYGALLDFLHHSIGSTHVVHHLNHQIPHYHAREATEAIKKAFPDQYLYDPTPIWAATYRVACKCVGVVNVDGMWVYRSENPKNA